MTDRYDAVTVVFDKEIREDDLDAWIQALHMMRNVIKVIPVKEESPFIGGGYWRAKHDFQMKLYELAKDFGS